MRTTWITSTLLLLALWAAPARAERASLAVLPARWGEGADARWRGDLDLDGLTRSLLQALTKSQKFDLVERTKLNRVLEEQKLTDLGLTDPKRSIQAGKLIGADFLLLAQVSSWELSGTVKRVPISNTWLHERSLRLVVDLRIVAGETGKVVLADRVEEEIAWRQQAKVQLPLRIESKDKDLLVERGVAAILAKVLEAFPMKVMLAKADGTVFVNHGAGTGIEVGHVYDVWKRGESLVDPDTGEVLGHDETRIGRIRITAVEKRFSRATVLEGRVDKGAVCKRLSGDPKEWPAVDRGDE